MRSRGVLNPLETLGEHVATLAEELEAQGIEESKVGRGENDTTVGVERK